MKWPLITKKTKEWKFFAYRPGNPQPVTEKPASPPELRVDFAPAGRAGDPVVVRMFENSELKIFSGQEAEVLGRVHAEAGPRRTYLGLHRSMMDDLLFGESPSNGFASKNFLLVKLDERHILLPDSSSSYEVVSSVPYPKHEDDE